MLKLMKNSENTPPATSRSVWLLTVAVFGFLWFIFINQLRIEWTLLPQYSYGWAVPFLCAYLVYLAWERGQKAEGRRQTTEDGRQRTEDRRQTTEDGPVKYKMRFHGPRPSVVRISAFRNFSFLLLFVLLAFLYLPVRLIQAANPVWTLVSWGLALVVIGLTLCFLRLALPSPPWGAGGRGSSLAGAGDAPRPSDGRGWHNVTGEGYQRTGEVRFSDFVFPICFFLVAVPWPFVIENPLIQWLTRADARATVELVGWFGIPALPHGNVIEVATGTVGISEACSGIRSFQATLMISLFLGELYRLSGVRRTVLCLGGFAMSFLFNLVRMSLLVWVAASKGIDAIANWHDPAGVTILVACFCGLWAFAVWMENGKQSSEIIASHFTDQRKTESSLRPRGPTAGGVVSRRTERKAENRKQKTEMDFRFLLSQFLF